MKFSEVRKLSGAVWFLIIGTMLSKASYFISMPYLALRMKSTLGADPFVIGVTLGVGPLVGMIAGFYLGHLSDHWGRKVIFVSANFIWSLTFVGFGLASSVTEFALLNMINGLCHSTTQPVSAALISDATVTSLRKTAFHLRYFAINVGASVGPLVGAGFLLQHSAYGFFFTAMVYFLYGLACLAWIPSDISKRKSAGSAAASFGETMAAIIADRPLLYYTVASVFMGATYAQLDSTFPQFLQEEGGDAGIRLFSWVIGMNAATVVLLQVPLTRLLSQLSLLSLVRLGSVLYGVGVMLMGVAGYHTAGLLGAMFVLTLGEILIFSNGSLLIDQLAPEDKKGAYFGAGGLWAIGATFGPALGGWVMMLAGGRAMFLFFGVLAILNVGFYNLGERASRTR